MSTLADMIADDLGLMDGAETVSIADRGGAWSVTCQAIPSALKTWEIEKSKGAYRAGDMRLHAQAAAFPLPPKPGDTALRADGSALIVLAATEATIRTRYACVVRSLAIAGATTVTAELMMLSGRLDAMGVEIMEYVPTGQSWTAQLQPLDVPMIESEDDRLRAAQTFRLYLPVRPVLSPRSAFRVGGKLYRWKASADADRIDLLPNVDLEDLPL